MEPFRAGIVGAASQDDPVNIPETTDYNFVAGLTASLRDGSRRAFHGLSGTVASNPSGINLAATRAADALLASRMGTSWGQVASVAVDSLDIFV